MADLVGQQLGKYRLMRLIGRGGFADVYLGEHLLLQRQTAIKVLHASLSEREVESFQREAQIIAALDHPHIIRVFDFDVQQGVPFLAMDYLPRGTLRDRHHKGERVPLPQVISYVKQIADALQYAHDQRLIHRDVKPENMLIGRRGEVVLSDFGIAAVAHSTSSMTVQASGGTAPYMAPEQIESHAQPASDQYALGIVVYEWLCGERPFDGESIPSIWAKHISVPPPSLREKNPSLPVEVEQVVMKSLTKDYQQRFASIAEFAQELERASQLSPAQMQKNRDPSVTLIPTAQSENESGVAPTMLETPPALPETVRALPIDGVSSDSSVSEGERTPSTELQTPPVEVRERSTRTTMSPVSEPSTGVSPVYISQPPSTQNRWQPWLILLSILMIAILIIGGVLIGLQLSAKGSSSTANQQTGQTVTQATANPTTLPSPQATQGKTPAVTPTATPKPSPTARPQVIPKGSALYTTNTPGTSDNTAACDGGSEQWANYNSPTITCQSGDVILHNPQEGLAGTILLSLANNAAYATNYVVEAQVQEVASSQADFGLYFRNQPGDQQGTYSFLLHVDGSWSFNVYDNTTGVPTQVNSGSAGISTSIPVTLDVAINGASYTFYVNGQQIGQAHDGTYLSGTTGIFTDSGGTIAIRSFAVYTLA